MHPQGWNTEITCRSLKPENEQTGVALGQHLPGETRSIVPFPKVSLPYPEFTLWQPPIQKWPAVLGLSTSDCLRKGKKTSIYGEPTHAKWVDNRYISPCLIWAVNCAMNSDIIVLILQMENRWCGVKHTEPALLHKYPGDVRLFGIGQIHVRRNYEWGILLLLPVRLRLQLYWG